MFNILTDKSIISDGQAAHVNSRGDPWAAIGAAPAGRMPDAPAVTSITLEPGRDPVALQRYGLGFFLRPSLIFGFEEKSHLLC